MDNQTLFEIDMFLTNGIDQLVPDNNNGSYKILITIFAVATMAMALLANGTLLAAITCPTRRQAMFKFHRSNDISITIFIAVLAVDDTLMALVNGILLILNNQHDGEWFFGETVCRYKEPVMNAVVGISCWLMMVIAWQRHQRLGNNLAISVANIRRATLTAAIHAGFIVAIILAIHVISSLPAILNSHLISTTFHIPVQDKNGNFTELKDVVVGSFCVQTWQSPVIYTLYSICSFLLSFLLPLAVTIGIHLRVIAYLASVAPQLSCNRKYLRKTTHILVAVLITFALCWAPFKTLSLFISVKTSGLFADTTIPTMITEPTLIYSLKLLTIAQACLNPIMYGWFITRRRCGDGNKNATHPGSNSRNGLFFSETSKNVGGDALFKESFLTETENDL